MIWLLEIVVGGLRVVHIFVLATIIQPSLLSFQTVSSQSILWIHLIRQDQTKIPRSLLDLLLKQFLVNQFLGFIWSDRIRPKSPDPSWISFSNNFFSINSWDSSDQTGSDQDPQIPLGLDLLLKQFLLNQFLGFIWSDRIRPWSPDLFQISLIFRIHLTSSLIRPRSLDLFHIPFSLVIPCLIRQGIQYSWIPLN